MSLENASDDFRPTADWPALELRAELLRTAREFFHTRGLLEVETPIMSRDTVVDRHIEPFAIAGETASTASPHSASHSTMWLQTSPEFAMKRLMAAGGAAIYQITRAFRQGERGRLHNPEFTIVEWYCRGDDLAAGMQFLSDFCEALLGLGPAERLSFAAAFERAAGIDPHRASVAELSAAAARHGVEAPASLQGADRDAWIDLLLVTLVEPQLGQHAPTILFDYPASQAALAVVRDADPPVAERFELYVRGIELANGYHELLDADALLRRSRENNAARAANGRRRLPEENRLLAAMRSGLPACAGAAFGFDRAVMLAAGADSIDKVIAFPAERA